MGLFGINSTKDKLELLKEAYEAYKKDRLNINLAEKICLDAWHLNDWVFVELYGETARNQKINEFRTQLFSECPEMKVLHDIANTGKHKILTRSKSDITDSYKQYGVFKDGVFADGIFQKSDLVIQTSNQTISVETLVEIAIKHWSRILKTPTF